MLKYMDKWSCPIDCRYANKTARWAFVIIISNVDPFSWYRLSATAMEQTALGRRLNEPMGRVTQVIDQAQEIDLLWWRTTAAPAAPHSNPSAGGGGLRVASLRDATGRN